MEKSYKIRKKNFNCAKWPKIAKKQTDFFLNGRNSVDLRLVAAIRSQAERSTHNMFQNILGHHTWIWNHNTKKSRSLSASLCQIVIYTIQWFIKEEHLYNQKRNLKLENFVVEQYLCAMLFCHLKSFLETTMVLLLKVLLLASLFIAK